LNKTSGFLNFLVESDAKRFRFIHSSCIIFYQLRIVSERDSTFSEIYFMDILIIPPEKCPAVETMQRLAWQRTKIHTNFKIKTVGKTG